MVSSLRVSAAALALALAACQAPAGVSPQPLRPMTPPPPPAFAQPAPFPQPGVSSQPTPFVQPGVSQPPVGGVGFSHSQTTGRSSTSGSSTSVTNPIPGGTTTQTSSQSTTRSSSTTTGFSVGLAAPAVFGQAIAPAVAARPASMGGAWRLMGTGNSVNCTITLGETGPGSGTINAPANCYSYLHLKRYEFRGPDLVLVDAFGAGTTLRPAGGYFQGSGKNGESLILQR